MNWRKILAIRRGRAMMAEVLPPKPEIKQRKKAKRKPQLTPSEVILKHLARMA